MMSVLHGETHPAVCCLRQALPEAVTVVAVSCGQTVVGIDLPHIEAVCRLLRDTPDLQYSHLSDLCGVDRDYPDRATYRFEVIYQLYSPVINDRLCLKIRVGEGERIPTVTCVWTGADWLERECWEMFGIYFDGHPDVRRLLTMDEYEGFPLRKDFPVRGRAEITAGHEGEVTWRPRS